MRPTRNLYAFLLLCTLGLLPLLLLLNTMRGNTPSSSALNESVGDDEPVVAFTHDNLPSQSVGNLRIITLDQVKNRWKRLCENACSQNGFCLLGKCFCKPGFDGADCSQRWSVPPKQCILGRTDTCFYHPAYGVAQVSMERWKYSQSFEQDIWATRDTDNDRNEGHANSFDNYRILPDNLGKLIEIGGGPFTQTKTILEKRKPQVESITILEPNVVHYVKTVKHCTYAKDGTIDGYKTILINGAAEDVSFYEHFDTLVMINVIEHVFDAFKILEQTYDMIKPGGIIVWHERLWDNYRGEIDNLREFQLHPIRLNRHFANFFMSKFETLYMIDQKDSRELQRLANEGVYFIGRKPLVDKAMKKLMD